MSENETVTTLASWNVNSLKVRLPQVLEWLDAKRPGALVLQETKTVDVLFPAAALREAGYASIRTGQKTYNGAALLYREELFEPAGEPVLNLPGYPDEQKRFAALPLQRRGASSAPFWFCGAYVPNGMSPGSWKYLYKLDWLAALERALEGMLERHSRLVIGGDFNIAPADSDCHNPAAWAGNVLVSKPERAALRRIERLGLSDSFRLFSQPAESYSWWDYRRAGFEKNQGLRIDLLLVSDALKDAVRAAGIDTGPRALPQPSDHAPVTVTLAL